MKDRTIEELEGTILRIEDLLKERESLEEKKLRLLWTLASRMLALLVQLPPDPGVINPQMKGKIAFSWRTRLERPDRLHNQELEMRSRDGLYHLLRDRRQKHGIYLKREKVWSATKPNEFIKPSDMTLINLLEWILERDPTETLERFHLQNEQIRCDVQGLEQKV